MFLTFSVFENPAFDFLTPFKFQTCLTYFMFIVIVVRRTKFIRVLPREMSYYSVGKKQEIERSRTSIQFRFGVFYVSYVSLFLRSPVCVSGGAHL